MAGYQDFSKSNNAVEAEAQGLKPLRLMTLNDLRQAGWAESKAFAIWLAKENFWQTSEVYGMRCLYDPTHLRELWEEAEEDERKHLVADFAKAKKPLPSKVYENCMVGGLHAPLGEREMRKTMNKDAKQRTFTFGEMDHLASVVGDLAIDQFSNQREYREAIYRIFSCYVFNEKPVETAVRCHDELVQAVNMVLEAGEDGGDMEDIDWEQLRYALKNTKEGGRGEQ